MKIAWIQYDIKWLDQQANLNYLQALLEANTETFDLLVLPEMFDTGFAMQPESIPNRNQETSLTWMQDVAEKYQCAVMGSMAFKEGNRFYNRLFFTNGEEIADYDKNHLFKMSGEHLTYEESDAVLDMHWKEFKIRPLICYDLRFPEIARNTEELDMLIYIASWPETRDLHWKTLLQARAIENQCYVLGVNRIGKDGNKLSYIGQSTLFSYDGTIIEASESRPGIYISEIEKTSLHNYRTKLPFLKDCKLLLDS